MKKALIIGVSGQDGALLAKLLLDKNYEVFGTSRDASSQSFSNLSQLGIKSKVKLESLSTHDFRSAASLFKRIDPDEIYHLAGQSSVGLSFEQPIETFESIAISTLNLLETLRFLNLKSKFYSAGSSECFGNTRLEGARESDPFEPRSPYAIAKSTAFWQIANYREAYNQFACTGILFNHESQFRNPRFVTKKIVRAAHRISLGLEKKLTLGDISIIRDWGWAEDYVEAIWLMLQQDKPRDFVISTGDAVSLRDFTIKVFSALNLNWEEHVIVDEKLKRPTDIRFSKGDSSLAKNILGWSPKHNIDQIIQKLIVFEKQEKA